MMTKIKPESNANDLCLALRLFSFTKTPEIANFGTAPSEHERSCLIAASQTIFDLHPLLFEAKLLVSSWTGRYDVQLNFQSYDLKIQLTSSSGHLHRAVSKLIGQLRSALLTNRAQLSQSKSFRTTNAKSKVLESRKGSLVLRPKILLVDDNPVSIKLLDRCFRALGCETVVVTDGATAAEEILATDYDLIVLDWLMPKMNGPEVLSKVQDRLSYDESTSTPWSYSRLPVIAYSGRPQSEIKFPNVPNFQFVEYIPKTAQFSELKEKIKAIVERLSLVA